MPRAVREAGVEGDCFPLTPTSAELIRRRFAQGVCHSEASPCPHNVKTPTGFYSSAQGRRRAAHPGLECIMQDEP